MRNLVESWVQAELSYGNTPATALRQLNESLGTKYNHSRLSQWRRGVYTPAPSVLSMMLFRTLPWAIDEVGIEATDEQLQALDGYFWNLAEDADDGRVELL